MKDITNRVIWSAVLLCGTLAAVVIMISAKINFEYGSTNIDFWVGSVLGAFGGIEIGLPILSIFAVGWYRTLGHGWALLLALVSVVTAASFLSTNRYKAEDKAKGYSAALSADHRSLADAQAAYSAASIAYSNAAAQCTAEIEKGRNGYQTRACKAADSASAAQNVALSELNYARGQVKADKAKVINAGDGLFIDVSELVGGTPQGWRAGVNFVMSMLIAFTGFVLFLVVSNVCKTHIFNGKPAQAKPEMEKKTDKKPEPQPKPGKSVAKLKSVEVGPVKKS